MNLQQGGVIGITCPSGYVSAERIQYAITVLERWGYKVKVGKTVGNEFHYFAGTDHERLADMQAMLDDPEIDAILMGRGGYGMSRIIDDLDFNAFKARPKWVCGFSDITVLHSHITATLGIPTLHSPMCGAFKPETENEDYLLSLKRALAGEPEQYIIPAASFNKSGRGTGVLTGGNLSLLVHMIGTSSDVDTKGKILFLEDLGEHLYHIDRMLLQLKRAGKLDGLTGLVLGGFTDLQDTERPFGQTIEEIIWDKVKEYDYPVCFNFPCGHQDVNYTLALGMRHTLTVNAGGAKLVR
ncbi:LD-carboxypeptidase [Flavipsychrobacter stenotrophus]|uniref:LD-carboxypeptidase n=1 Tax=Flavipsychrobacter stenotrophus TaxID=2077091 RepID=A0A2S7SYA9_9BACT|nr:LD-carboxypeptidase [Flavipsychrobacter stenotrophus]PQJ11516.1 LD-carboxypeptidase [Flavipsychrobacter stenotrophus]